MLKNTAVKNTFEVGKTLTAKQKSTTAMFQKIKNKKTIAITNNN